MDHADFAASMQSKYFWEVLKGCIVWPLGRELNLSRLQRREINISWSLIALTPNAWFYARSCKDLGAASKGKPRDGCLSSAPNFADTVHSEVQPEFVAAMNSSATCCLLWIYILSIFITDTWHWQGCHPHVYAKQSLWWLLFKCYCATGWM